MTCADLTKAQFEELTAELGSVLRFCQLGDTTPIGRGNVDLDPVAVDESLSYAGVSYRWRALVASAEVEKGNRVSYAFRVGSRF